MKVLIMIFLCMGTLIAADPIGKVIAVEGKAEANKRSLSRGSGIFVSDVIKVAAASKIQIRFTDGGILNLIELTEYSIDSYQFKKTGQDNYTANLIKGGFRELTGEIGKENPDNVNVKTPVAIIGIRGTMFSVNMQSGEVFFGCDSGMISVSNRAGEQTLGAGQYVSATSMNQLGNVTDVRPDALRPEIFASPIGGESLTPSPRQQNEIDIQVSQKEGNPPC